MNAQLIAASVGDTAAMKEALHELTWGVARSVRYHEMRQSFYENADRLVNAITAIAGSSAVIALAKTSVSDFWFAALAALVAIAGVINLTMKSTTMAARHAELKQRFVTLQIGLKSIDWDAGHADRQLRKFEIDRLLIEKDEPAIRRLVDVMAHNELARAAGCGDEYVWFIPFRKRITAHWRRGNAASLKTVADMHAMPRHAPQVDA